ncbi:MAG: hypothetical protein HXS48_05035 [Theionarchaea archaeon]|nr:MAG: hypothetical protein AYK19_13040 [Theionarchaea archaeon DG-70-1]MBU7026285.1 hypothetical protein [Theionarchaea archaeon]
MHLSIKERRGSKAALVIAFTVFANRIWHSWMKGPLTKTCICAETEAIESAANQTDRLIIN